MLPTVLAFLVGFEVVLEMNSGVERPIGLLRLVFHVYFGKRQAHGLRVPVGRCCRRARRR